MVGANSKTISLVRIAVCGLKAVISIQAIGTIDHSPTPTAKIGTTAA
jgi:hypothetical protein